MNVPIASVRRPPRTGDLWAAVLAGGDGVRLRPLTRWACGDERPKQFAALVGSRSLLGATLDRVALGIPPERTVVVTRRSHAGYLADELARRPSPRLLAQPADRGTAAAILLAAHWISWRDPGGAVAVFPSDHFVADEAIFMDHVLDATAWLDRHPGRLVLLGAVPTEPETEYGWIEPGDLLGRVGGEPIRRARRFWEKPSPGRAARCLARGCLWNTFVLVASVATLVETGWGALPRLSDRLARIEPFAESEDEAWAIQQAYALAPEANFSRAVLEPCPPSLAVARLPSAVGWCDWGTPERVIKSLRTAGVEPPWLHRLDRLDTALA